MKVLDRTLDVDSTLEGERVGMTIDQSALAHIMSVLTDLYSDPELAVIREYSTNALDAHIAAGVTRPIEVTLPSPLSPFLRIRDFGAGLDADDIRDIYSRYGTSTKRDSNDVVGMLGLGCKSALTYTDQFTLTGIKDGVMTQVSISRDEDGAGSMTIVAQHPTSDESGVEVVIPAKRHNSLDSKAADFFAYWTPSTVLVNGEQPKRIDGTWVTPSLCVVHTGGYDAEHKIVMGNVPYPLDVREAGRIGWKWPYGYSLVAFVPIGDVQFTPSRESLQMTRLTKGTLERVNKEAREALATSLQKQVAAAGTPMEAVEAARKARALGVKDGLIYQGIDVPNALTRPKADGQYETPKVYLAAPMQAYYKQRKVGDWQSTCPLARDVLYFDGFDGAQLTATKRAKLEKYLTDNGIQQPTYLIFADGFTSGERFWIPADRLLDWAPVDEVKLPRAEKAENGSRPRGSYKGWNGSTWYQRIEADKIDPTATLLYVQGNIYGAQQTHALKRGPLCDYDTTGKYVIVCLEANRVEKFKRDFPHARHVNDLAREKARDWFDKLDADTLKAAAFQRGGVSHTRLRALDATLVDDPDVAEGIRLASVKLDGGLLTRMAEWGRWAEGPARPALDPIPPNPLDKYPLLTSALTSADLGRRLSSEHAVLYINAAYADAAEKEAAAA